MYSLSLLYQRVLTIPGIGATIFHSSNLSRTLVQLCFLTAQVARLADFITDGYNLRKHTELITLDLGKAYDSVWIHGLLYKLISFQFPAYIIHFLHSYLSNRSFSVAVSDKVSPYKLLTAGLPQGAVLSPILFSIYTADFPRTPHVHTAIYADETAIYSQSWRIDTVSRRLSRALDRISHYCTRWRLKLNIEKTTATIFTKRRPTYPDSIQVEGIEIPWTRTVKYLGLYLTSTLNYNQHIKNLAHKALGNLITIFPLLGRQSILVMDIKLHLYKAIIRSMMTYAAPVWCGISDSTYRTLQVVQNKCLRVITNSERGTPIRHLHDRTGLPMMQPYIMNMAARFYKQCMYHPNPLIRIIGNYTKHSLQCKYKKYKNKRPRHRLMWWT
jgi:hypothetical protein